jgi:hypothetical protein
MTLNPVSFYRAVYDPGALRIVLGLQAGLWVHNTRLQTALGTGQYERQ